MGIMNKDMIENGAILAISTPQQGPHRASDPA